MLDLLGLLDLQKLRHALLAKLASFAQTMLGLLDLRKLRLTRSLARTMLDLRRLRQAHSRIIFLKKTRFSVFGWLTCFALLS